KDELQATLLAEETGEPVRVRRGGRPRLGLEEELVTVGMAAVVKKGDAVAISGFLEDVEHLADRGVRKHDDLAQAGILRTRERGADAPQLLREVTRIASTVVAVVGEGQEENRLVTIRAHGAGAGLAAA